MPNNCLSVLYKHIIQVENKNVGLKVGGGWGHKHTIAHPIKKVCVCGGGGAHAPSPPPPRLLRQWYIMSFFPFFLSQYCNSFIMVECTYYNVLYMNIKAIKKVSK